MASTRFQSYPKYRNSGVEWLGEIPSTWRTIRLKHVVSFYGGGTPSKANPDFWKGDIPWVSPKDMKCETIEDAEDHVTEEAIVQSSTRVVQSGAVLVVVRSGILKHSIPVAINVRAVALNQDMKALVPRSGLLPVFLKYFIAGQQKTLLMEWRKEGATVESIEHDLLANTMLPISSAEEQRTIAALLDRETAKIDVLVAKKERLIELLQEKRAALITRAVTKGLDPTVPMKVSGVEWIGQIPAHWTVRRLKFLAPYVTSGSRGWAEYYSDEGPIFLRIGNLSRNGIDLDLRDIEKVTPPAGSEGERTRVKPEDLLISITAYIGSVGVVPPDFGEGYVNQHIALARVASKVISSRWLAYCLLSSVGQKQFQGLLYGGTKEGLGLDDVRNLTVLLPAHHEQESIINYMDHETAKIDALISKVREGTEKLKEYRTALISAAVTGKIDVREEVG